MHTLIIGAGAAGIAAAIAAAQNGDRVTVLERNRKPLKKVGVTGNGRGNLLNRGDLRYYGDTDFALKVMHQMPYERVKDFLVDLGIALVHEGNLIYPSALLASVAVDAMLDRAKALNVQILLCTHVKSIKKTDNQFIVTAVQSTYEADKPKGNGKVKKGALLDERTKQYTADKLIVAIGGAAAPAHGTDGTGYGLLTAFGHEMTPIRPALSALTTDERPIGGLAGQRVRATLILRSKLGDILATSKGEVLFAADGVSGIAAMQLARFFEPRATLEIDMRDTFMGDDTKNQSLLDWLKARAAHKKDASIASLFTGAVSAPLSRTILRAAELTDMSLIISSLTNTQLCQIEKAITTFTLKVKGTRSFDAAQVTAGGIRTAHFNPQTMQSLLVPELYAAGEVLNVDGDCGGYNLMFAFASGLLAGGDEGDTGERLGATAPKTPLRALP